MVHIQYTFYYFSVNKKYPLVSILLQRDLQSETRGMDAECQMTRRFVTRSRPLSPEFPWMDKFKREPEDLFILPLYLQCFQVDPPKPPLAASSSA